MIIDNADDATVLLDSSQSEDGIGPASARCRLFDFLPRVEHGAVLITTRDRTCALKLTGYEGTPIEVSSMKTLEAVGLLRNRLPDATEVDASELVKELEYVPLAISQASAYIKTVPLFSVPSYLAIFRHSNKNQATLLNKDNRDLRRDQGVSNAVITSWELSFHQIRKKSRPSADLLSLMCYFNRTAIPQLLIQGNNDDISFYEIINPLLSFSLIRAEIGEETFEMHRLVQTATRHWLQSEGDDQLWKERAIQRVAIQFPKLADQAQHWPICESLMSHADEVILYTAKSKESQLVRATVLVRTAWYIAERKAHDELAEQRSTDALEIQRRYFDENSEEIITTLSTLAHAQSRLLKYEETMGLRESILKQREEKWGSEHNETLIAMHNLASSYQDLGQFDKAEDLLKRVVEVRNRAPRSEDSELLNSENALAELHLRQGKFKEAEKLSIKVLEISTKRHGVNYISTLNAMNLLSKAYSRQKKFNEAEDLIAQAIPLCATVFGSIHWRTLEARRVLAYIYYQEKKLDDAKKICNDCLDIAQKAYGSHHPTMLDMNNLLGLIYRGQGCFIDASKFLKDVVESHKTIYTADHPETLIVMHNLAACYYDMGEKDQAIQLMTEVLEKRKKVLYANHPDIANSAGWLAYWKSEGKKSDGWETEEEGSQEETGEEEESEDWETEEEGSGEEKDKEDEIMREQLVKVQISSQAIEEAGR